MSLAGGGFSRARRRIGAAIQIGIMVVTLLVVASPASADNAITVTTTQDVDLSTAGVCSLRGAIRAANTNSAVGACPAGSSTEVDVITVPAGTYTLAISGAPEDDGLTGDLDLYNGETTIEGAGADVTTIDAAGLDRVFDIRGGTATISGVTITGGQPSGSEAGGGVLNSGGVMMSLLDVAVTGNSSSGYGGGVFFQRQTTIRRSSITGNAALGGGAITAAAHAWIEDSTIADNRATGSSIGALYFLTGVVSLKNLTVTGNDLAGISRSGGIITVRNSIVANQTSGAIDCFGGVTSGGGNLDSDDSCFNSGWTDQVNVDPLLSPLADNGGTTLTMLPGPGSPAIDAGVNASCTATDQIGTARPTDGDDDGTATCDVGALEVRAPLPPANTPVTQWHDLRVSLAGSGQGHVIGSPHLLIECEPNCSSKLASHTFGRLSATPADGSIFTGWSGDCLRIEDDACVVHMTLDRIVTATFEENPPPPQCADGIDNDDDGSADQDDAGCDDPVDDDESDDPVTELVLESGPCAGYAMGSTNALAGGTTVIVGTEGDDELIGTDGDDIICGLEGYDVVHSGKGNDVIAGNQGLDNLRGGSGMDVLYGGDHADWLHGGRGDDILKGQAGDDHLRGAGGSDTCVGGPGNNRLVSC